MVLVPTLLTTPLSSVVKVTKPFAIVNLSMIKMNAQDIVAHLRRAHRPDHYFCWDEVRIGGGFSKDSAQRFDFLAIDYRPSKRNAVKVIEIKVSRSDFMVEINKPKKRRAALRLSNLFYFCVPKGLLKIEEIPVECGLLEVQEDGSLVETIHAPYRESVPTWLFVSAILRALDKSRLAEWKEIQHYIDKDKAMQYAATKILKRRIDEMKNYKLGNKEVPDKIAVELEQALFEIIDSVENNLFEEEND